ncbi:MAG: anthranilate synthase component I, partial [Synechococcaceae bacterium WBB_32_011]|nr:anthranilate synthase component I [Synechococcaceae bacterium WBB_32_011]
STWLKVGHGRPYGFLLESVEGGDQLGRWSFVASDPLWVLTSRAGNSTLTHRDGNSIDLQGNPFQLLREQLKPYQTVPIPHLPPVGQLFGFWGYELIQWIEPTVPVHPRANAEPPDGCWMLCDSLLVFDQVRRQITAISYANIVEGQDPNQARAEATQRLEALEERLHQPLPAGISPLQWQEQSADQLQVTSNTSQAAFEAAVSKAEEHILAGDVFQLVLSQRLEAKVQRDPFDLYRSLRMVNPSPYMGFFSFNGWFLIGSSPEVMVKADPQSDGSVKASVRPIAGTRPRGETAIHDLELEKELLADPKERAEHVMLVDLGRNDLGRVCAPGSVAVQELMVIERYSHVMHIVSQVEGLLRSDCDVWDLLQASFPAGTVSGAPKIRAMQLI